MTALERIEDALAKMTPGEWEALLDDDMQRPRILSPRKHLAEVGNAESEGAALSEWLANAAGIVALRNLTPALVAEVKRLREALLHIAECDRQPEHDRANHYQRVARAALEPQP